MHSFTQIDEVIQISCMTSGKKTFEKMNDLEWSVWSVKYMLFFNHMNLIEKKVNKNVCEN